MKLKDYRKLMNLTREQAGAQIGVSGITVWRWESGVSMPGPDMLIKIKAWSRDAVTADDVLTARKVGA